MDHKHSGSAELFPSLVHCFLRDPTRGLGDPGSLSPAPPRNLFQDLPPWGLVGMGTDQVLPARARRAEDLFLLIPSSDSLHLSPFSLVPVPSSGK